MGFPGTWGAQGLGERNAAPKGGAAHRGKAQVTGGQSTLPFCSGTLGETGPHIGVGEHIAHIVVVQGPESPRT